MENILLEFALEYCERGWYVFPCRETPGNPYTDKMVKLKFQKKKFPILLMGLKTQPQIRV